MTAKLVARALFMTLEEGLRKAALENDDRAFFRLDGFADDVYRTLCDQFGPKPSLGGRPVILKVTNPLGPGYEGVDLEAGKTPTYYRNNVPPGQVLVLVFNKITSDRQSLANLFLINESVLANEYLHNLIGACFQGLPLKHTEEKQLTGFVNALTSVREPQLRSLVGFLCRVRQSMEQHVPLNKAIGSALPAVQLFKSAKVGQLVGKSGLGALIKKINNAANHTLLTIESKDVLKHLERLNNVTFESEPQFSGEQKRRALEDYLRGTDSRAALEIDWSEIELLVTNRSAKKNTTKKSVEQQLKDLGVELQNALKITATGGGVEQEFKEALQLMTDGQMPDPEIITDLLDSRSSDIGAKLVKRVSDVLGLGDPEPTEDFPLGVTALAVKLLGRFRIVPETLKLIVRYIPGPVDPEVLSAFQLLYGGIAALIPVISWELPSPNNEVGQTNDGSDTEDTQKNILKFEVVARSDTHAESYSEQLLWLYRAGSPLSDAVEAIKSLRKHVAEGKAPMPILSTPPIRTIPDVANLSRDLGPWWENFTPARSEWLLGPERRRGIDPECTKKIAEKMENVEAAFADLLEAAPNYGVLMSIGNLLTAYDSMLATMGQFLETDQESRLATDLVNRSWTICDPENRWVVLPLLHPMKLLWFLSRVRYFNQLLYRLLTPNQPPAAVDMNWLSRDIKYRYSSAYFPAVLVFGDGVAKAFLPAEESDGAEIFRPADGVQGYVGSASNLEQADRTALKTAAEQVIRSLDAYREAHPFTREGMAVLLANVQAPALPIEVLKGLVGQQARVSLTVHCSANVASVFSTLNEWVDQDETLRERDEFAYFPKVSVRVQEGELSDLVENHRYDVVVLVDALSTSGQEVAYRSGDPTPDQSLEEFVPFFQPLLNPFAEGAERREVSLNPDTMPSVVRRFYACQAASKSPDVRPLASDYPFVFKRVLRLGSWPATLRLLHEKAVWVVCYDINADRFLLEHTADRDNLHIIRYVTGLGPKKLHNLTVSSSYRVREEVVRRMAQRLDSILPDLPSEFRKELGRGLVERAQKLSGSVVLRAAGPGTMLNELLGLVMAQQNVEERIRQTLPDCLITWVYLDDYKEWFGKRGKRPDMLAVAARMNADGVLGLRVCLVEAKCVSASAVENEHTDALEQVVRGDGILRRAFTPGSPYVDSEHWYRQLYQAIMTHLEFRSQDLGIVRALEGIRTGQFVFSMTGEAWVFGYDDVKAGPAPMEVWEQESGQLYGFRVNARGVRHTLKRLLQMAGVDAPAIPDEPVSTPHLDLPEPAFVLPEQRLMPEGSDTAESAVAHTPAKPEEGVAIPVVGPMSLDAGGYPPGEEEEQSSPPDTITDSSAAPTPGEPYDQPSHQGATGIDLLANYDTRGDEAAAMQYANDCMEKTIRFLRGFDQRVNVAGILVGPRVIRLKLNLLIDKTSNFKNVNSRKTDLKLQLKLNAEPLIQVGNDGTVWIDIPRPQPATVGLKPLLDGLGSPALPPETRFPLGLTMDGTPFVQDLRKVPHWLVGGTSGSGKSVFLRAVLLSLMLTNSPSAIQFVIIDPKGDLVAFRNSPYTAEYLHTRQQLAEQAVAVLKRVKQQMDERLELMVNQHMVNEIDDYHRVEGKVTLPRMVILIEEFGDLVSNDEYSKELNGLVEQIAAIGRAPGFHLFVCTQNPVVKTVSTDIKANCSGRVALWVKTGVNSTVILDEQGAEDLLKNGDMLYKSDGPTVRIQAPYVDNLKELQPILKHLNQHFPRGMGGEQVGH